MASVFVFIEQPLYDPRFYLFLVVCCTPISLNVLHLPSGIIFKTIFTQSIEFNFVEFGSFFKQPIKIASTVLIRNVLTIYIATLPCLFNDAISLMQGKRFIY